MASLKSILRQLLAQRKMSDFDRQGTHGIDDMPSGSKIRYIVDADGPNVQLTPYEQTIVVAPDLGSTTIILPTPQESSGRFVSIHVPDIDTVAAGSATSLFVKVNGTTYGGNAAAATDGLRALYYSDGYSWTVLRGPGSSAFEQMFNIDLGSLEDGTIVNDFTLDMPTDAPASADALRDNLVATTLSQIRDILLTLSSAVIALSNGERTG